MAKSFCYKQIVMYAIGVCRKDKVTTCESLLNILELLEMHSHVRLVIYSSFVKIA